MTTATTPWGDMFPKYRFVLTPAVTVARIGGRTLIGNRGAIWDAGALRPHLPTAPDDGYYQARGRRLAPDTTTDWKPIGQQLHAAFESARSRGDVPVTVTGWAYRGERVIVTPDGQPQCIPEGVADLAIGLLDLRAVTDPGKPLAAYRYIDGEPTLVGLVQGYNGYQADPVMAAIVAGGDYYAAV